MAHLAALLGGALDRFAGTGSPRYAHLCAHQHHDYPSAWPKIEKGTVLIKDGLIKAVGKDVKIPGEAQVIRADSMYVYAGFIEGISHTGIPRPKEEERPSEFGRQRRPEGENPGHPSNKTAGVMPDVAVKSVLAPKEASIANMRQLGFTAAHVVPMGRMLPGTGAVVLLHGQDADRMVLKDQTALYATFATAPGVFPSTVIGVMSKFKELYRQAQLAKEHTALYARNAAGIERPAYDGSVTVFFPVIDKKQPVFFKAPGIVDAQRALLMQKEMGYDLVLTELKQGWDLAAQLKQNNVKILVSMDIPEKPKEEKKADAALSEALQKEKEALEARKAESIRQHQANAAALAKAGLSFGFSTIDVKSTSIRGNLRLMIENGLTEDQALAALTTAPAAMLGVSNMLGTIEAGKIANLVVTNKPYFAEKSDVRYVFVDGVLYEYELKPEKKADPADGKSTAAAEGTWNFSVDSPNGVVTGKLSISNVGGTLNGTISTSMSAGESKLNSISLKGNELTFDYSMDIEGQSTTITGTVTLSGETFDGTISAGNFGSFPTKGNRVKTP